MTKTPYVSASSAPSQFAGFVAVLMAALAAARADELLPANLV